MTQVQTETDLFAFIPYLFHQDCDTPRVQAVFFFTKEPEHHNQKREKPLQQAIFYINMLSDIEFHFANLKKTTTFATLS